MTVIPRWEWRTFGDAFGQAEAAFAALTPTGVQESDERYLLGEGGENVKVRDDLMDIKVLREVDVDGLERWEPILKASFPMSAADVALVAEALHIPVPVAAGTDDWTLDAFLAAVAGPGGSIRGCRSTSAASVPGRGVHRRGHRLIVDGRPTRTIAIDRRMRRPSSGVSGPSGSAGSGTSATRWACATWCRARPPGTRSSTWARTP